MSLENIANELGIAYTILTEKDEKIIGGRIAKSNRWIYEKKFTQDNFADTLNDFATMFIGKEEIINRFKYTYEEIEIVLQVRSDFGQMGIELKDEFMQKIAKLGLDISIDILSFGLVKE